MKYILLLLLFCFSACEMLSKKESANEVKKESQSWEGEKKQIPVIDEIETNSEAQILNDITVHESGGLKASRVYLAFEDKRLVPKTNHVSLGTPVYLVLQIKKGWQVKNGMVSLDASEKIMTNNSEVVLNAISLFKTTSAVRESDASQINLKAVITKTRPDIDYFIVNYRLWDKNGRGEIKGSYRLYITAETK